MGDDMFIPRRLSLVATGGGTLAIALLVGLVTSVSAAYPPGGYPGPGPAGAFPTVDVSQTVGTSGGTLSATDGSVQLTLTVPAGAFSQSTQITIYKGSSTVLASLLPSGEQLLLSYAVGWTPTSTAGVPLTLTITDTAIPGDATVYETTSGGLTPASGSTVRTGSIDITFSSDPGFVVAAPGPASTAPVPTTGGAAAGAAGPPVFGFVVAGLGVLAILGGLAGWRRRNAVQAR